MVGDRFPPPRVGTADRRALARFVLRADRFALLGDAIVGTLADQTGVRGPVDGILNRRL